MNIDRFLIVNIYTEQEFIPESLECDYLFLFYVQVGTGVNYVNYSFKVNGI